MDKKNILPGVEIVSLALLFKKEKALVIGDLHLGQEEALNNSGVMLPRTNFDRLIKELKKVFSKIGKVETVILTGDVKHEFGKPGSQEWKEVLELLDFLHKKAKELIIIRGNHDNYLSEISSWKKIKIVEKYSFGNYLFCHGNKLVEGKEKILIIGHEHSAVNISDEYKKEKYKCFAKTKIRAGNKTIIVMPSFNFLSIGTDIIHEKLLSPYLKGTKKFEIWAIENGKTFYFGETKRK
jgi:uncharacterized protein